MDSHPRARSLRLDLGPVKRPSVEEKGPTPGKLQLPTGETYTFTAEDLVEKELIGMGNYGGAVMSMIHRDSGKEMAVKRVRAHDINSTERQRMLRELQITIDSQDCSDIVRFYGAVFQDGDCWICMELMDCSLDKFYRAVYKREEKLPEEVIGFITASVVRALNYLKEKLNIIHRDVKPSNVLLDRKGFVKLCDFGISGYLVDSIAKTQDVGCQVYLSPERLSVRSYDIRSDVWSLGISLVEICIGHFPYTWTTVFEQIQSVVHGDPPCLTAGNGYSIDLVNFVNRCLIKDLDSRPKFHDLMEETFFQRYNFTDPEEMAASRAAFGQYAADYINEIEQNRTDFIQKN